VIARVDKRIVGVDGSLLILCHALVIVCSPFCVCMMYATVAVTLHEDRGAVASARANAEGFSGRKASPEWSPTDCQPCASL
jgi:hypothetical protein